MVANLFIRKIYSQHFQWIKLITVAMPLSNLPPWSSNRRSYNELAPKLLVKCWEDKDFSYVDAWKHLAWNLKRMERLRKLTLVLPLDDNGFYFGKPNDEIWKEFEDLVEARPDIKMVVVRMRPTVDLEDGTASELWIENVWEALHAHVVQMLKSLVQDRSWKVAFEHKRGCWQSEDVALPSDVPSDPGFYEDWAW